MEIINKLTEQFMKNSLLKGFFFIGSGNVFAQLIGIISLPIISRMYSPADFGILGVFIAVVTILSVFGSLKYCQAIPLQKSDINALNLLVLCIGINLFLLLVFVIIAHLIPVALLIHLNIFQLKPFFILLMIAFFGIGIYEALNYWLIREQKYWDITVTKINQSLGGNITKIGIGFISPSPNGLIIGQIISNIAGIITIWFRIYGKYRGKFNKVSFHLIRTLAKEYASFPKFTVISTLLFTLGMQSPSIVYSIIYGSEFVGYYYLALQVITIPVTFISSSLSQVYYGEVSNMLLSKKFGIYHLQKKISILLFISSILFIIIPSLFLQLLFPAIFGAAWEMAGSYCVPLGIVASGTMVLSVVSKLQMYGYNHWGLYLELFRIFLIGTSYLVVYYYSFSLYVALWIYALLLIPYFIINYIVNCIAIVKYETRNNNPE